MEKILLAAQNDPSLAFVCFFGIAVVFAGLVVLIGLIYLMNFICDKFFKDNPVKSVASAPASAPVASADIPNRGEIVAAVCTAIAEEEGTDISAIRVLSFKKLS